ncbi:hypothetical protein EI94DRAFT_1708159 [Lactarius quietus]|nr:hypothetical protein EI94DRAFT_1708159 [Lactarius quietus]
MSRPARKVVLPSRFTDNLGEVELIPLCRAIVSTPTDSAPATTSSPLPVSSPPPQTDTEDASSVAADPSQARSSTKRPSQPTRSSLSLDSVIILSPTTSDGPDGFPDTAPQAKKSKTSLTPVGREDTLTSIIDIDDIEDPRDEKLNKSDPTADIKYFFTAVPRVPGQPKGRMRCNL